MKKQALPSPPRHDYGDKVFHRRKCRHNGLLYCSVSSPLFAKRSAAAVDDTGSTTTNLVTHLKPPRRRLPVNRPPRAPAPESSTATPPETSGDGLSATLSPHCVHLMYTADLILAKGLFIEDQPDRSYRIHFSSAYFKRNDVVQRFPHGSSSVVTGPFVVLRCLEHKPVGVLDGPSPCFSGPVLEIQLLTSYRIGISETSSTRLDCYIKTLKRYLRWTSIKAVVSPLKADKDVSANFSRASVFLLRLNETSRRKCFAPLQGLECGEEIIRTLRETRPLLAGVCDSTHQRGIN
ncbi:hypothetical protein F2P81_006496 [Scophthalmus maximus]|uniref:Uncharacterized protein n=1 Tax=Scophthalmus maximus TaxID=52904 RepID=A0A6A4T8C3_SCOMX|nr:hypothetical protein F2P81_006496 [Scophthalmus maximus]